MTTTYDDRLKSSDTYDRPTTTNTRGNAGTWGYRDTYGTAGTGQGTQSGGYGHEGVGRGYDGHGGYGGNDHDAGHDDKPTMGERAGNAIEGMRDTFGNIVENVKDAFADDGRDDPGGEPAITYNQITDATPDPLSYDTGDNRHTTNAAHTNVGRLTNDIDTAADDEYEI